MEILGNQLGVTGWQALSLVIGTTVVFWVFTGFISFFGRQVRARFTGASVALMMLVGGVAARSMLGLEPTMAAGLIVLAVLVFWEAVFVLVSHRLPVVGRHGQAHAVLRDGVIQEASLRQARIRSSDLIVRLRHAGVTRLADVALVIVERDGALTIIRVGQPVDQEFLTGVAGLDAAA